MFVRTLLCFVSRRRLGAAEASPSTLLVTHRERCARCAELAARLDAIDVELAAAAPSPAAPASLRHRVLDAYHRELAGGEAPAPRLPRLLAATGALATVALIGAILWTRLEDFGPPPQTVRIDLPAGTKVVGAPRLSIQRASGVVEEIER